MSAKNKKAMKERIEVTYEFNTDQFEIGHAYHVKDKGGFKIFPRDFYGILINKTPECLTFAAYAFGSFHWLKNMKERIKFVDIKANEMYDPNTYEDRCIIYDLYTREEESSDTDKKNDKE